MPKTVKCLCRKHSTASTSKLNGYAEDSQLSSVLPSDSQLSSKMNGYTEGIQRHNHAS